MQGSCSGTDWRSGTYVAVLLVVRSDVFIAVLALQVVLAAPAAAFDPFTFFRPSVVVTIDEQRRLELGQPIARVLPGREREVAVFAALRVDIDGDRLIAWMRRIADLKKSPYVVAIGRFSDPPGSADLEGLTLDDEDLSDIRRCLPGDCALKLTGAEIDRLRHTFAVAGAGWKSALQDAFRHIVLARVQAYLIDGLAMPEGERERSQGAASFSRILRHSVPLTERLPQFAAYLDRYPHAPMPGVESFVYWSKERLGGRPIVRLIHVSMLRPEGDDLPDAIVAGKEIFATRYINSSLGLTAVMRGAPGSHHYLVYLNRSEVDALGGFFGGFVRWLLERRLATDASDVLQGLRLRLESGDPDRPLRDPIALTKSGSTIAFGMPLGATQLRDTKKTVLTFTTAKQDGTETTTSSGRRAAAAILDRCTHRPCSSWTTSS
jgi:hypothetical protein